MTVVINGTTGITTPSTQTDQFSILGANYPGLFQSENLIINGAFDIWQRGSSFTANQYGADRWFNSVIGGTVTMARQAFTLGETFGSNNPSFFMRQTVSGQTLASHQARIQQRIEGVRSYAGQTITVLGWARRSSGTGNMAVNIIQGFGTGGSPSPDVLGAGQIVTLTTSWQPFALTFAVPSVTGRTLGTNSNDICVVNFWTSAGSDFNALTASLGLQTIGVDIWGVHIRLGTHTAAATTLYRQPEIVSEMIRCERYYQTGYFRNRHNSTNGDVIRYAVSFRTRMRGSTSISLSGTTVTGVSGVAVINPADDNSFTVTGTVSGTITDYASFYAADSEL